MAGCNPCCGLDVIEPPVTVTGPWNVRRHRSDGSLRWQLDLSLREVHAVRSASDRCFVIGENYSGDAELYCVSYTTGKELWSIKPEESYNNGAHIKVDYDGEYIYVYGGWLDPWPTPYFAKIDFNGNVQWTSYLGGIRFFLTPDASDIIWFANPDSYSPADPFDTYKAFRMNGSDGSESRDYKYIEANPDQPADEPLAVAGDEAMWRAYIDGHETASAWNSDGDVMFRYGGNNIQILQTAFWIKVDGDGEWVETPAVEQQSYSYDIEDYATTRAIGVPLGNDYSRSKRTPFCADQFDPDLENEAIPSGESQVQMYEMDFVAESNHTLDGAWSYDNPTGIVAAWKSNVVLAGTQYASDPVEGELNASDNGLGQYYIHKGTALTEAEMETEFAKDVNETHYFVSFNSEGSFKNFAMSDTGGGSPEWSAIGFGGDYATAQSGYTKSNDGPDPSYTASHYDVHVCPNTVEWYIEKDFAEDTPPQVDWTYNAWITLPYLSLSYAEASDLDDDYRVGTIVKNGTFWKLYEAENTDLGHQKAFAKWQIGNNFPLQYVQKETGATSLPNELTSTINIDGDRIWITGASTRECDFSSGSKIENTLTKITDIGNIESGLYNGSYQFIPLLLVKSRGTSSELFHLAIVDTSGNVRWTEEYGIKSSGTGPETAKVIRVFDDGEFILCHDRMQEAP